MAEVVRREYGTVDGDGRWAIVGARSAIVKRALTLFRRCFREGTLVSEDVLVD